MLLNLLVWAQPFGLLFHFPKACFAEWSQSGVKCSKHVIQVNLLDLTNAFSLQHFENISPKIVICDEIQALLPQ